MTIHWKYNHFGHVEIWEDADSAEGEADLYLQVDTDVQSFFEQIGVNPDDVEKDETGECEDPGYF